ncbi:MAG: NAD(P)-dependent oxidoreductase [Pseudomonadota bacterium]
MTQRIGFIGLGIMGGGMAANLLKAGHPLVVTNRTKAKADVLVAAGARWADTPRAVAESADVLFTMLSTPAVVRETAVSPEGLLNGLAPGSLWVDCSTLDPASSREMAAAAAARGIRFVDAPVAGSRVPAQKGELVFFAGGDAADVNRCRPFFEAMGKRTVHVGGAGMGAAMKMVFNLMLGISMGAFAEALSLGAALGLSREQLMDTLMGSPVAAPFIALKRPKIEAGEYAPDFPLKWMHKDLQLVAQAAVDAGTSLPIEKAAKTRFGDAVRKRLGENDFSAICSLMQKMS